MGYIRAPMRSRSAILVLTTVLVAGCGSGPRQDADEPSGSYKLEVAAAKFPASQSIAEDSRMIVTVRNDDTKAAPNVAVTVETDPAKAGQGTVAFGQRADDSRLSDNERPVWIVNEGPPGGDSAATNTWALGRLGAGETKTFTWKLTAVEPGSYTLRYRISPGLAGKAKLAAGGRTDGLFKVTIDDKPVPARVNDKGQVVRGETPGASK
jgi:hypothetical protein